MTQTEIICEIRKKANIEKKQKSKVRKNDALLKYLKTISFF